MAHGPLFSVGFLQFFRGPKSGQKNHIKKACFGRPRSKEYSANNKGTWLSTEGVSGTTLASETGGGGGNGSGGTVDENSQFTSPQSLLISGSAFKTVDLNGDGLLDIAWIENGNIRYALRQSN
ncbi:VCBS repeat-containing protein [Deltaproteobacteria bacterium TL4]